jgi:hypothetical protein
MLAKRTSKNQLTLPKEVLKEFPDAEYFDVSARPGEIVLRPALIHRMGENLSMVREKVEAMGITEKDLQDAIEWARKKS